MTLVARPAPTPRIVSPGQRITVDDALLVRDAVMLTQAQTLSTLATNPRPWAEQMLCSVVAVFGDYLECRRIWRSAVLGSEAIYVAKPSLLRQSVTSRDGVTYVYTDSQTRTASKSGETDESQLVTPTYLVADVIEAVFSRTLTGITQVDEQRRPLVDINADGRAWATVPA